jgi:hypothetical protein
VVVTVYDPADGSLPMASVNYVGLVYVSTGINKAGLFAELNNGMISGGAARQGQCFVPTEVFKMLQNCASLKEMEGALAGRVPDCSCILNVAEPGGAASFEWATDGFKRRGPDRDGLLVSTNHFVDPAWHLPEPLAGQASYFTVERRNNLLQQAEASKGTFNPNAMMKVVSRRLEDGGSFRGRNTCFQVVAMPSTLKIWVRVPPTGKWSEIDLEPLFED